MTVERSPLQHLNPVERRLFGWLVVRMFASENPRFTRALADNGPVATARLACVNVLRLYAMSFFLIGMVSEFARSRAVAYPLMALAAACVLWSCWCLYTAVGPEREYKREHDRERPNALEPRSAGPFS